MWLSGTLLKIVMHGCGTAVYGECAEATCVCVGAVLMAWETVEDASVWRGRHMQGDHGKCREGVAGATEGAV